MSTYFFPEADGPSRSMYLYDHLHEVLYAQRGGEPACVGDDVDHGLEDADGLVHHALGVRAVVRVGQLVAAEVALQQQVHLLMGAAYTIHFISVSHQDTINANLSIV